MLKPQLTLRQTQRLALTPGMRTSLSVLRMSALDLMELVAAEAADNPFLLVDDRRSQIMVSRSSAYDVALDTVAAAPSLVESLRQQLGAATLPDPVRAIAGYLAGDLRDDGYLDTPLEELAEMLGLPLTAMQAGLAALQSCDPAGVGARNLAECLELQLIDRGIGIPLAQDIICHLDLFARQDWRGLIKTMDLPQSELERLGGLIRSLNPHPVSLPEKPGQDLLPDLTLEFDNLGAAIVRLGRATTPRVTLNVALIAAAIQTGETFEQDRHSRAEAMLAALKFRGDTLLRIGQQIVQHQHRFFAHGPDHLAPYSRVILAASLGLHPSTIGRAVQGKAIEAAGRLYPLAMFFSTQLPTKGNQQVSAFVVQRHIARMIEQEPADTPLSDDAICSLLHQEGVDIARRTVAKYRRWMRIPSSFVRRRPVRAEHRMRPPKPDREGSINQ